MHSFPKATDFILYNMWIQVFDLNIKKLFPSLEKINFIPVNLKGNHSNDTL
jgi:hypothetical protein